MACLRGSVGWLELMKVGRFEKRDASDCLDFSSITRLPAPGGPRDYEANLPLIGVWPDTISLARDARPAGLTRPQFAPAGARQARTDKMPKHLRYTALQNCQAAGLNRGECDEGAE